MQDWKQRFQAFGYASISREEVEAGNVDLGQLRAFAEANRAKVVDTCTSHGMELKTAMHIGIVKLSPRLEFGCSVKKTLT